jgi:hypothetical protein
VGAVQDLGGDPLVLIRVLSIVSLDNVILKQAVVVVLVAMWEIVLVVYRLNAHRLKEWIVVGIQIA